MLSTSFLIPVLFIIFCTIFPLPAMAEDILVLVTSDSDPYSEALAGFQKACDTPFKVHNIRGEPANARSLSGSLARSGKPVVVAIGTPALEAAIKFFPTVPILFTMNYSPPREVTTRGGMTGVFLDIPLENLLVLVKKSLPNTKRVGILMNPLYFRENVEDMKVASKLLDINIHIKKAATLTEALYAVKELALKNEVVILQPDPLFSSDRFFRYALRECLARAVPITGVSEAQVRHGALFGPTVDYAQMGSRTGQICNQVVKGARLSSLPITGPDRYQPLFNVKMAETLGLRIPSRILEGRENLF